MLQVGVGRHWNGVTVWVREYNETDSSGCISLFSNKVIPRVLSGHSSDSFSIPFCFPDILPKPVISTSPPVRGQELQIRCKGWLAGMGFALYKEGLQEPVQQLGAIGREAFFTIRRMEDKDEGNYSCRTHTEKPPFKWSEPSETLELVIKGIAEKCVWERRGEAHLWVRYSSSYS